MEYATLIYTRLLQVLFKDYSSFEIMKVDPYNHKEKYQVWKEKVLVSGIPEMSKTNSDLTLQYLQDMEHGLNVSIESVKGGRGYPRLNTLREKMGFFSRNFKSL